MSTPILFNSGDTLFQYFSKQHLDRNNQLSEEEWEDFLYYYQSDFAAEATETANIMFSAYLEDIKENASA